MVFLGIIIEEQSFAQAAAGGDELFGTRCLQKAADNANAGQNDITTFTAEAGNFFALLQICVAQSVEEAAICLRGIGIIVDFGCRIFLFTLDDFSYRTRGTADADERQSVLLEPGVLFQTANDKKAHVAKDIGWHDIACVEHGGGIDCADRQGYAFQNFTVFEQNQLGTAAAQVKDDAVLDVDGVDNAKIADIGFGIAGDDVQLDACFLGNACDKLRTVGSVADGCSSNGNGFVSLINFAHIGKAFHGFDGAAEGYFCKHVFFVDLLTQAQCFFLVIDHIISTILINMADNKPGRVGADVDNCDSLHFSFLLVGCSSKLRLFYFNDIFIILPISGKNPA